MDERPAESAIAAIEAALLPCPHCGPMPAAPEMVLSDTSRHWQVYCGPCGSSSGSSKDPQRAADGWNSRASARPSIPHSSPALIQLALLLGNSVADLSPNEAAPVYGFSSDDKRLQAFDLARRVVALLNATALEDPSMPS
jgi:hypothetical protein